MKFNYDRFVRGGEFVVGDRVWLTNETPNARNNKFKRKWLGPYTVIAIPNTNTYEIKHDHKNRKIIVNGRRLKRCFTPKSNAQPLNTTESIIEPNPTRVRRRRPVADLSLPTDAIARDNGIDNSHISMNWDSYGDLAMPASDNMALDYIFDDNLAPSQNDGISLHTQHSQNTRSISQTHDITEYAPITMKGR